MPSLAGGGDGSSAAAPTTDAVEVGFRAVEFGDRGFGGLDFRIYDYA